MNNQSCIAAVAKQCNITPQQVERTLALLDDGGTIPFIARYRKEQTGSLDEIAVAAISEGVEKYRQLEKRKSSIVASLEKRELLTEELNRDIAAATTSTELEDIYLPYRQKRRTRAVMAREKGLEPLAEVILAGGPSANKAKDFLDPEAGVGTVEEALAGARDIVAERVSEDGAVRAFLRRAFKKDARVRAQVVAKNKDKAEKYRDYFDFREAVGRIAGHRVLALFRGEAQDCLRLTIRPDSEKTIASLQQFYCKQYPVKDRDRRELLSAIEDGYTRLLAPSLENELRGELKGMADGEAIEVFSKNLEELLLSAPLGQKRVMALDPGYRTGAKLVCLNAQGGLVHTETVYPTQGGRQQQRAADTIRELVQRHAIEAVAIGDGTAGRETERFIRSLGLDDGIIVTLVNEDGASVYSASEAARREFPDEDITVRGAVSIGRRLQDPLAELVKIDPKSIGVGQYQHDVNQAELKKKLSEVVIRCVNRVGVEVNSASVELLCHVAGLGITLAENIVEYRRQNGQFRKRSDLLKVKRLGAKAYEQCAGFLRIHGADNPLDNSGVHPERYDLVDRIAADNNYTVEQLMGSPEARKGVDLARYCHDDVGLETLHDIMTELGAPGRDPREQFRGFQYDEGVHTVEDLREGMILPAIITNVTKFGAFADVGVKRDGLIHISRMAKRFVKDPAEVVRPRQQVRVKVVEIDSQRQRIGLSLLLDEGQ